MIIVVVLSLSYNRKTETLHHGLPVKFDLEFLKVGIDIQDPKWALKLKTKFHNEVVHNAKIFNRGGPWNKSWIEFFENNPTYTALDVEAHFDLLVDAIADTSKTVDEIDWP